MKKKRLQTPPLGIGIDLNSFFLPLGLSQVFGQRPFKWGVQLPKVSIPVEIMPENQSAARIFHWQSNWFAEASIVQSRQSRGAVQHWRHRKNRRLREVWWFFKEGSYLASMSLVFFEAFISFRVFQRNIWFPQNKTRSRSIVTRPAYWS